MFLGQLILFLLMVFLVVFLLSKRRQGLDRLLLLIFILVGIISILAPDLTTTIANRLGIGRGVDLIIYLFIIFNLYFVVFMLNEYNRLLRMITTLVREIALLNARSRHEQGADGRARDEPWGTKTE